MFLLSSQLGQVPDASAPNPAAWAAWLKAQRNQLEGAWNKTVAEYKTLMKVRADLGLPFIVDQVTEQIPTAQGAWTSQLEQDVVNLQFGVNLLLRVADEALASKREISWDTNRSDIALMAQSSDSVRIEIQSDGTPLMIDTATSKPYTASGQVGIAWAAIPFGPILSGAVIVFGGAYLIYKSYCDQAAAVEEQKTFQTIAKVQEDCIATGKCTPDQAANLAKSIYDGAKGLAAAKAEEKNAEPFAKATDLVSNVIVAGVILGAIAAGLQIIKLYGDMKKPAAA